MTNRVQIESTIASRALVSRALVSRIVQEIQDLVLESLRNGEKVSLVGFGVFHVRLQKARRGKNPKTGEPVDIAASLKPAFRASKTLIQALNLPKPAAGSLQPPGSVRDLKKALILHEALRQDDRAPKGKKKGGGKKKGAGRRKSEPRRRAKAA